MKPLLPRRVPPIEQPLALPTQASDTTFFVRDADYFGQTVQHGALSTNQASNRLRDSDLLSEQSNFHALDYP